MVRQRTHFLVFLALSSCCAAGTALVSFAKTTGSDNKRAALLRQVKKKDSYRKMEWKNAYQFPEQVVLYYAERDASGFVFTGLMDLERRAFTTWPKTPKVDSFLVARDFKIGKATYEGLFSTTAIVPVEYNLIAVADANGTRTPASRPRLRREYRLERVEGKWLIKSPEPAKVIPIVVESKFPYGFL